MDVNDYFLVFFLDDYSIFIFENIIIEILLLIFIIIDEDIDIVMLFFFEILLGDWVDIFDVKLDLSNIWLGILYIIVGLDCEFVDSYILEIIVKDEDGFFDICFVIIIVLDVNDNGLYFVLFFFVGSILENIVDL